MKGHKTNIEIRELILAKADWTRTYIGTIDWYTREDGSKVVIGKVKVNESQVVCKANNIEELGKFLDDMVILILDYDLNNYPSIKFMVASTELYQN